MNNNLQTGPFVKGGTKRKRDKVIQIKIENRFCNTQRISVLWSCFSLYICSLISYILVATLKQDLYRKMPDPILQPSWMLQTNKKVALSVSYSSKEGISTPYSATHSFGKDPAVLRLLCFPSLCLLPIRKSSVEQCSLDIPWPEIRYQRQSQLHQWYRIQCRLIYPATLLLHFFPRRQGGIISLLIKFIQPYGRSVPHRFCLFQGFLNVHCEITWQPICLFLIPYCHTKLQNSEFLPLAFLIWLLTSTKQRKLRLICR